MTQLLSAPLGINLPKGQNLNWGEDSPKNWFGTIFGPNQRKVRGFKYKTMHRPALLGINYAEGKNLNRGFGEKAKSCGILWGPKLMKVRGTPGNPSW